jgi:phosphoribosyl-AMP cyclohydrolase / phosphoribosyl-ATP pyrophosphohydrolase
MESATKPLVVVESSGSFRTVEFMNQKAFNKSIENGELWVLHPETAKVLPMTPPTIYATLLDKGRWYEALLPASDREPATAQPPAPNQAAAEPSLPEGAQSSLADVVTHLAAIIADRKATKPEGSYTAYLFKEGADKIRKKTGEEAIELILAREKKDIVWEAADLIYHLFVLLAEEYITTDDIARELEKRAR